MSHRLPLNILLRPPEYGPGYPTESLFDEAPSTYWCTPTGPSFPVVLTVEVAAAEALVERFVFDTRVKGWETSAARRVSLEVSPALDPTAFQQVAELELEPNALLHVVPASAVSAARVRLTMHSNHGGNYLALQRFHVLGRGVGVGEVMLPPGARVTDGQRDGVVVEGGYSVRWGGEVTEWVAARALQPASAAPAKSPAKSPAKRARRRS
ncbi:MAG: hypothetical protein R3A48_26980 [Polyangiales bacterium]